MTPAPVRERLAAWALLAAWWLVLALLVWVCFLRPSEKSLALTITWFVDQAEVTACCAIAISLASFARGWRRPEALASLACLGALAAGAGAFLVAGL